jgi:hypothetical protein
MHTEAQIETALDTLVAEQAKIPDSMRSMKIPGFA